MRGGWVEHAASVLLRAELRVPLAIAANIVTSVSIILASKALEFQFELAFTCLHFLVTSLCLVACWLLGLFEMRRLRLSVIVPLSLCFCLSIALNNLSLKHNSVGVYELWKALVTPTLIVAQTVWLRQPSSLYTQLSLVPVVCGVIVATASDVSLNIVGTVCAVGGLIFSAVYQLLVANKQRELEADAFQMLMYQAPISTIVLALFIPASENIQEVTSYAFSTRVLVAMLVMSFLSFFVNLTTIFIISHASPVTFNVIGYFKLCCVLLGGYMLFGVPLDWRNTTGVILTLFGVLCYTVIKIQESSAARAPALPVSGAGSGPGASSTPTGAPVAAPSSAKSAVDASDAHVPLGH